MKKALIVSTKYASLYPSSGAGHRVASLSKILEVCGLEVSVTPISFAKAELKREWDVIVLCSFSTLGIRHLARKKTQILWFDPYDSWKQYRLSRFKGGEVFQIVGYVQDYLRTWMSPNFEMITFISSRDAAGEKTFLSKKNKALQFVFPNSFREISITPSQNSRIVFVGDSRYPPNNRAIRFIQKLAILLPDEIFEIIGSGYENSKEKNLKYVGFVSDNSLYKNNDIHLAPLSAGAGVKNKVIEPLSLGLPVITTDEGANGLKKGPNLFIANSLDEYAKLIIGIRRNTRTVPSESHEFQDLIELDQTVDVRVALLQLLGR